MFPTENPFSHSMLAWSGVELKDWLLTCFNAFPPQSLICCSYRSWSACLRRCLWEYWLSPLWRAASWADWLDSAPHTEVGSMRETLVGNNSMTWIERRETGFKVFWQSWHNVHSQRSERYGHVLLIHMWMLTGAYTQTHVDSLQASFYSFHFELLMSLCICSEWLEGRLDLSLNAGMFWRTTNNNKSTDVQHWNHSLLWNVLIIQCNVSLQHLTACHISSYFNVL